MLCTISSCGMNSRSHSRQGSEVKMKSKSIVFVASIVLLMFCSVTAQAQKAKTRSFTPAEIAINPFGQSKAVVRDYRDDGDIQHHNQWWGIQLISYAISYDDDAKSNSIVVSSLNSIKEVRAAGNIVCGLTDAEWKRRDDPDGKVLLDAENKHCRAGIDNFTNGTGVVTLGITRK